MSDPTTITFEALFEANKMLRAKVASLEKELDDVKLDRDELNECWKESRAIITAAKKLQQTTIRAHAAGHYDISQDVSDALAAFRKVCK